MREFGEPYEDYRGRVPMLVPFTGDRQTAAAEHRATA